MPALSPGTSLCNADMLDVGAWPSASYSRLCLLLQVRVAAADLLGELLAAPRRVSLKGRDRAPCWVPYCARPFANCCCSLVCCVLHLRPRRPPAPQCTMYGFSNHPCTPPTPTHTGRPLRLAGHAVPPHRRGPVRRARSRAGAVRAAAAGLSKLCRRRCRRAIPAAPAAAGER